MKIKNLRSLRDDGFTLIELLMVIAVIGILSAIGITQFTNFGADAKNAAVKANLNVLRNAIASRSILMSLRCDAASGTFPPLADLNANDITTSACTQAQIGLAALNDDPFVAGGIPANPWTNALATAAGLANKADQADAAAILSHTAPCIAAKTRGLATATGWCYDVGTGKIWANSENNGLAAGTATEDRY